MKVIPQHHKKTRKCILGLEEHLYHFLKKFMLKFICFKVCPWVQFDFSWQLQQDQHFSLIVNFLNKITSESHQAVSICILELLSLSEHFLDCNLGYWLDVIQFQFCLCSFQVCVHFGVSQCARVCLSLPAFLCIGKIIGKIKLLISNLLSPSLFQSLAEKNSWTFLTDVSTLISICKWRKQ